MRIEPGLCEQFADSQQFIQNKVNIATIDDQRHGSSAALTGTTTVDAALAAAQASTLREMVRAGYGK